MKMKKKITKQKEKKEKKGKRKEKKKYPRIMYKCLQQLEYKYLHVSRFFLQVSTRMI